MNLFRKKSGANHKNPIRKHLGKGVKDVFFLVEGAADATLKEVTDSAVELLTAPRKTVKTPKGAKKNVARAIESIDVTAYNERIKQEGLEVARKAREASTNK